MYKLLLCLRYLRTRYIALASIVSVTLGVATMIVVNSVMAGFSHEMQKRIHGVLSDIVVQSRSLEGFPNPELHMQELRRVVGDDVEGTTATIHIPAMLSFHAHGQWITRQVNLVGVDEATYAEVSDFGKYLLHPENRRKLSFALHESGYDVRDRNGRRDAPLREDLQSAGWQWRRVSAGVGGQGSGVRDNRVSVAEMTDWGDVPADFDPGLENPFSRRPWDSEGADEIFDPAREQHTGLVLGIALVDYRYRDEEGNVVERFLVRPGDDVKLTFPTAGTPPQAVTDSFTIVDFYESKMSEYDSTFAFMPLAKLQQLRGMIEPQSGTGFVTAIQIRLREGANGEEVRDRIMAATTGGGYPLFPPEIYNVQTWRDKQGPLLDAVEMETAVLNILLFLIIGVAGFGILATFFMIVVEKTKDIGILKSLGASAGGVMGIFVTYGLSLGSVGAGAGLVLGLLFVRYINEIRRALEWFSGREVFDPTIYYFHQIPTIVSPWTVGWIVAGAILIAVLASVLPAIRAALLHPVEALRA